MKDHRKRQGSWITIGLAIATISGVSWVEAGTTRHVSPGGDIQGAINSSVSGDTVHLDAGTFRITSTIVAKTGVTIEGAGRLSTTVAKTGGGTIIDLNSRSNVQIANLTLNGSGSALYGIDGSNGSGHHIHDSGIQDLGANANGVRFSGAGGTFTSGVTDSRIENNQFSNIGVGSEWGAGVRMAWGSSRNQVVNNAIANAGRGGIFGNDGSTDLVIKDNTVTGSGSGGTGLGIEVWHGCDRALVENNTIDQWLSVEASSQVAVRNNRVNGGYLGLEFASSGHDNVFSNNTINGASIGISVSGPTAVKERVLWSRNTIRASTSWGAQIMSESAAGAVMQMYFYKNTFQGSAGAGFRFHPNYPNGCIQNVTLDSNTITANQYGITGGDWGPSPPPACLDKFSVINNSITNNSLAAFSGCMGTPLGRAYFGNDLRWEGNTVTGNGTNNQQTSKGTFFPGKVPSVSIIAPAKAIVGRSVRFSLSYTGADPQRNALWDLGDGLPVTTSSASFTYMNPGVYRVGLVVWDTSGRAAHDELLLTVARPQPFRRGDSNSSGTHDIADAIFTLSYLFAKGTVPRCLDSADANDNGEINIADVITLLSYLFGNGPLPPPGDTCGADPTIDDLDCAIFPPCEGL